MAYNLLVEPWVPVLGTDGKPGRVGVRTALLEAGRIRQLAASNPMDNVSLLRFLLAILIWCKPDLTEAERERLCGAPGIPKDWLNAKLGTEDRPDPAFDLLGDTDRFYQDQRMRAGKTRPIGDLLQEFPTETKIAHFRHVRDWQYGLCPACCALGVVRFCTFANAYGQGTYTSAVNGPTPAYATAQGETLLQTLILNWPMNAGRNREPPWLCDKAPNQEDLDAVTVFAWRSRRLWLGDPGSKNHLCSYCGQAARLIERLAFTGNWKPPFETAGTHKKFWDGDPHLIFEAAGKKRETDEDTAGKKKAVTTLGFPAPGSHVAAHAKFWRRALSAVLARADATRRPGTALTIRVAGPAANKGLYQDSAALSLASVPMNPTSATRDVVNFLTRTTERLSGVLPQSTPNPKQKHSNRKAALDAMSPSLETRLREECDNWLKSPMSQTEGTPAAVQFPRDRLIEQLGSVVRAVVEATTVGSPLRRREAVRCAEKALKWETEKLAKADEGQPAQDATDKPKRGRRKRGGA